MMRLFRGITIVAALAAPLLLSGCAGASRRPLTDFGSQGTVLLEKRIARYPEINYAVRFRSLAYEPNRDCAVANSAAEQAILDESGQPDYVRKAFLSTHDDHVTEWAYMQKNRCVQFVGHEKVWDGPLSDKDRVVIRHGYPNHVMVSESRLGHRRETYIYRSMFDPQVRYYSFANDQMVYGKEVF